MKLPQPVNYLAQKLLYLWIRTEVTQAGHASPENPDNTIVIYVLESRSWSDLLVIEHECKLLNLSMPLTRIKHKPLHKWHHVYTIAQAQPLKAWFQQKTKHSSMLIGIYHALQENPELDVHFVPAIVFWGRPVLKQKHWFRVLFSDTWGFAGRTRRFFTILLNGKNTLLEFSPAISFRQLIDETNAQDVKAQQPATQANIVNHLQSQLSKQLIEMKTATLGPDISHRRTLVSELLENEDVYRAIKNRSAADNISEFKATKIAQKYLNEIVADRSYITIQILQRILTTFWNKFYSGIKVYEHTGLKQLALTHELIYVPCHRSHIDYLLLSYVIHQEGLAIPYIAAGKNLNMPIIGPILRKGGAFFIRRSFKGNELYSVIMFEYLASQLSTGMPVEYFVEGGRSRTGRLLQPRPGMLAMSIRAFLKYRKRPLAFIPVYIGYEKMIEGKAYLAELKGDDKKSETLLGSIRSIFKIRGFYGQVTTSFGSPVLLNQLLNEQYPDWQDEIYDDSDRPPWLKPAVNETAQRIMCTINASCHVNAVNLIATALLASPNQTMDEGELIRTLDFYKTLIINIKYSDHVTITDLDAEAQIKHAEALGLVRRRKHEMGDFIYLDSAHAILLTYYRNNILHLLVLPSLIACCFNNIMTLEHEKMVRYIKIAYPFLKTEFFLPWSSDEISDIVNNCLKSLSAEKLLIHRGDTYSHAPVSTEQSAALSTLAQIISPVLELYYMIFALLAGHDAGSLSRERLEDLCYLMAQRLSLMYEINSPDFFDKKLITNFINLLIRLDYVNIDKNDMLELSEYAIREGRHARRLLDRNMQYNILQMLGTSSEK